MRSTEVFRTAAFRAAVAGSFYFAIATLGLGGFILWQTTGYEQGRVRAFLHNELVGLSRTAPADLLPDVTARFAGDLHRVTFAAVFSGTGRLLAGDVTQLPAGLPLDGRMRRVTVLRPSPQGEARDVSFAVARRLDDGRVLLVGHSLVGFKRFHAALWRAFLLGVAPAILLALLAGAGISFRMLRRVADLNAAIERIMGGEIKARLPVHRTRDAVDRLAASVNRMLDRIEGLIEDLRGVGDDIAHDLRTPLARARSRLEGARQRAATRADLEAAVDRAIGDLDQTFVTITALLRIRQIETVQQRECFAEVDLPAILRDAQELYQPIAELKGQTLAIGPLQPAAVTGDRDLLFEAVANLLDNAVKFSPAGGHVRLSVMRRADGVPVLRVLDSGPGVRPAEQEAVMRRFYRSDPARHTAGTGLGLSLVGAILRLHGFRLDMHEAEGMFAVDVVCG